MEACANPDILRVIYFFLIIIDIVKIIIPIGLIIFGLIDFTKAVATNDEKEQKKSGQLFLKRLLYGVIVFFVPWIIEILMITLGNLSITDNDINFTDCLENANSQCIDTLDSKNLASIKTTCDVPDDFEIEQDDDISNPSKDNYITFDSSITFSYEYVYKSDGLSYALYTPSTAATQEKVPLIVWLHGSGSRGVDKDDFKGRGLISIVRDWDLQNFNAYIFSPHISGKNTSSSWGSKNIIDKFYVLFDEILTSKNIDTDKIILAGHSMGGVGVYTIANNKTHYYSAMVVMSGYDANVDFSQFKNMPVKGYVASEEGEHEPSYKHMLNRFVDTFGSNNLTPLDVSHGRVPSAAFNIDKNKDGKSDLIEWMLRQ